MKCRNHKRFAAVFVICLLLVQSLNACADGKNHESTDKYSSSYEQNTSSDRDPEPIIDNTDSTENTESFESIPTTTEEAATEDTTLPPTTAPPVTEPTTEPVTEPTTEPSTTEPATEPRTTEPPTESSTTEPPTEPSTTEPATEPRTTEPATEPSTTEPTTEPSTTEPRTTEPPAVVVPQVKSNSAPGTKAASQNGATVDYSNINDGYIMIKMTGATANLKVRIIYEDGTVYDYDLNQNGSYEAYPLQSGSGTYSVGVYQNNGQGRYAQVMAVSVTASLTNEKNPFLWPSQRVNYVQDSTAVAKSFELCAGLSADEEKVNAIYGYIVQNVKYDYDKAATVASNYISSADATLASNKGICLDYSVLMAVMLRVQGIPTQVVYGSATGASWHAWNKVYYNGNWVTLDSTFAAGGATGQNYVEAKRY